MNANDFTPSGLKVEGSWENDRNAESKDLFKAIMKEVFGSDETIVGHHLLYVCEDRRTGEDSKGRQYEYTQQVVQEIPSADTLIFDHQIAKTIWGSKWKKCLTQLALEPVESRDKLLSKLYMSRVNNTA